MDVELMRRLDRVLGDAACSMLATAHRLKKPFVRGMYPNPLTLHPWKYVYIEHDPAKWDLADPAVKTSN